MLRAAVVTGTTVVGVGAVLALNPSGGRGTALTVATVRPVAAAGGVVYGPLAPSGGSAAPTTPPSPGTSPATPPSPGTSPTARHGSAGPTPSARAGTASAPTPTSTRVSSPPASTSPAPSRSSTPTRPSASPTSAPPAPVSSSAAPASSPAAPTSATAAGQPVDVGYGIVQVQATVTGGKLVRIDAVQLPNASPYSANLNSQAWPILVQQGLQAQSSQIAGVSGATYTSEGFAMSLRSALLALGHSA